MIGRFRGTLPAFAAAPSVAVSVWLANLEPKAAGKTLNNLVRELPPLANILSGIAEAAPYLWDLIQADPARALRLLESDPDSALAGLVATTYDASAAARSASDLMRILRRMKAEAALLIALADIGGVWPVARVTAALTDVAETALRAAVRYLMGEAAKAKKLTLADLQNPAAGSGYIVLAMGKMGAHELNFSSDIDLMVFFTAGGAELKRGLEPTPFYVGLTRELVKILQERTADGYVFRVDLRLRPDPASTQIAISTDAALDYYESRGQNWERAALIKARPARATPPRAAVCCAISRPLSGANISITPPSATCTR